MLEENLKLADRLRELEPALGKNHALQQAVGKRARYLFTAV